MEGTPWKKQMDCAFTLKNQGLKCKPPRKGNPCPCRTAGRSFAPSRQIWIPLLHGSLPDSLLPESSTQFSWRHPTVPKTAACKAARSFLGSLGDITWVHCSFLFCIKTVVANRQTNPGSELQFGGTRGTSGHLIFQGSWVPVENRHQQEELQ